MKSDSLKELFAQYSRKNSREKFADWIWRGLQSFYTVSPAERARTFDNAGSLILQYESVCEGIANIYEEFVPENRQLLFRQAIGDILREKSRDHFELFSVFQDLIYLIIRLKANESLGALLPSVGFGPLGEQHPDLLYETMLALGFFAPSDDVYKIAFNLIDSPNFDDGYLFEAMKVLIECKPDHTAEIVLKFEPRLTQLHDKTKEKGGYEFKVFCDAMEDWAGFILKRSTLSWLSELWEKASHSTDQVWLFNCLFGNKSIPVVFNRLKDAYWINYRSKKVTVKVSEKDYYTRNMLLHKSASREIFAWVDNPDDKPDDKNVDELKDKIRLKLSRIIPEDSGIAA